MSEPTRGLRLIVLAALALGIVAALGAGAAPDSSGALKIAIVDAGKLLNDYSGTTQSNAQLRKMADDLQSTLLVYKNNALLSEAEQKRLGELTVKENAPNGLTDAEKNEKKRLADKSTQMMTEFTNLSTKNPAVLTDADRARIAELTKLAADTDTRFNFSSRQGQDQLQKAQGENLNKVIKDVREGIAKVAKEKGFNLVLSNELALYAESDITDEVLKKINGK